MTKEESANAGSWTGFTPPSPVQQYQLGDGLGDICQAWGPQWGYQVNGCPTAFCGMGQLVTQIPEPKPWNSSYGNPKVVVSGWIDANKAQSVGAASGWVTICPYFAGPYGVLFEYCIKAFTLELNGGGDYWKAGTATCGNGGENEVNTIEEFNGTGAFATNLGPGTTKAWTGASTGWVNFNASISGSQLEAAIKTAESTCKLSLSTNPAEYTLRGLATGYEFHGTAVVGVTTNNLKISTEYNPLPPTVSTGSATSVQQTDATVSGTVNPNGIETGYAFEYGETTAYGLHSQPEGKLPPGSNGMPVSATLTGLRPGTLYHYRLVASSSAGSSAGADQTFKTWRPSFNGDGLADLVTCYNNEYGVALSDGTRLNGAGVWSKWACDPHAVVGDFNGDGKSDILVPNVSNNTWAVSTSTGTGFGGSGTGTWLTGWTARPTWAGVGDFNGDGKDDLVVCENNQYAVALSDGTKLNGSGVWSKWGCNPHAVVGDFTGNGKDDIAVPNESNNTWAVGVSNGSSSFEAAGTGTWLAGWTAKPTWAGVGDFNGDGKDDLVVCENNQYAVALSDGTKLNGSGVWSKWACDPHAVVGDFNGDGKSDILVPNVSNNTWAVSTSTGTGFGGSGTGTWLTGWTAQPTWAGAGG